MKRKQLSLIINFKQELNREQTIERIQFALDIFELYYQSHGQWDSSLDEDGMKEKVNFTNIYYIKISFYQLIDYLKKFQFKQ